MSLKHEILSSQGDGRRRRSKGPLSPEETTALRNQGEPLGFDPVLMGRVSEHVLDDIDGDHAPPRAGWPSIDEATRRGESGGYRLRRWVRADAPRFKALLDDPEVWRYMPQPHPGTITEDNAADLIDLSNDGAHHDVRAITVEGVPVGQVRLEQVGDRVAEVSYWIGRAFWGRGIAGRVVSDYVLQAARSGRFDRITARVHRLNPASQRVLRRAGLAPAGPLEDSADWLLYERVL